MVLDPGIQLVVAKADEQWAREVVHVARVSGGAVPASVQSRSRAGFFSNARSKIATLSNNLTESQPIQ